MGVNDPFSTPGSGGGVQDVSWSGGLIWPHKNGEISVFLVWEMWKLINRCGILCVKKKWGFFLLHIDIHTFRIMCYRLCTWAQYSSCSTPHPMESYFCPCLWSSTVSLWWFVLLNPQGESTSSTDSPFRRLSALNHWVGWKFHFPVSTGCSEVDRSTGTGRPKVVAYGVPVQPLHRWGSVTAGHCSFPRSL